MDPHANEHLYDPNELSLVNMDRTCDSADHDWPAELTSDARCTKCGLRYDEWSE